METEKYSREELQRRLDAKNCSKWRDILMIERSAMRNLLKSVNKGLHDPQEELDIEKTKEILGTIWSCSFWETNEYTPPTFLSEESLRIYKDIKQREGVLNELLRS